MENGSSDLTGLLLQWREGNPAAREELLVRVYDELRLMAVQQMRGERPDHTLAATALVHEAWLRLFDNTRVDFQSRAHFFGAAARLMRQILVDHARARRAQRRGGGQAHLPLDEQTAGWVQADDRLLALDEALQSLAALDEAQARLVELRYFSGLSIEETAVVMNISPATVKRHWATARAYLAHHLREATGPGG